MGYFALEQITSVLKYSTQKHVLGILIETIITAIRMAATAANAVVALTHSRQTA